MAETPAPPLSAENDAPTCCICGGGATRTVATRGLTVAGQTLYCDRDAAELLARATSVTPPVVTAPKGS